MRGGSYSQRGQARDGGKSHASSFNITPGLGHWHPRIILHRPTSNPVVLWGSSRRNPNQWTRARWALVYGARVEHASPGREVSKYFDHNRWGPARHAFNPLAWAWVRAQSSEHDPDRESAHPWPPQVFERCIPGSGPRSRPGSSHSTFNPAEPRIAACGSVTACYSVLPPVCTCAVPYISVSPHL